MIQRPRPLRCHLAALSCALFIVACGGSDRDGDNVPAATDAPVTTGAQGTTPTGPVGAGSASPISDQDLQSYRLDMNRVSEWHRVQLEGARRPDLELSDDEQEEFENMDGATATRFVQRLEGRQDIASVIRETGMQPREFVLISFALANAGIGYARTAQGQPLPPLTNQNNVDFFRQNEAQLQRMQEEQNAARRAAGGS